MCKNDFSIKALIMGILFIFCGTVFAAKIEESQWQQGTLVSITTENHTRAFGSFNNRNGSYNQSEYVVTHYLIDTAEYRYEANRTLRFRWNKQLLVTVNGPIQFFFDGKKFYIRDEQKKQHELDFVQKIKK